jgi:hypothetical protein
MTSVPVPVVLAAALLAAACRGRPEPEQSGPTEVPAVLAVDSAFAAAVNAGDVEGIARTYDE